MAEASKKWQDYGIIVNIFMDTFVVNFANVKKGLIKPCTGAEFMSVAMGVV